ncbi:hypothetical protein F5883DRAFT_179486 [Diaporthe sp. PMI_573]|nr:hypothetical protein F5883DRAFT_179486 [Diaporthaceae sp. PMI_573]
MSLLRVLTACLRMPSESSHSPKLPFIQEPPSSHLRPGPPSPSTPTKPESVTDKQHLSAGGLPSIGLGLDQDDRRAHNGVRLAQPNPPSTPVIDPATSKPFTLILPPTPPHSPADTRSRARREGDINPGKNSSSSPLTIRTTTPELANSASNSSEVHFNNISDDSSHGDLEELHSGGSTTPRAIGRFFRPLANILSGLAKETGSSSRSSRGSKSSKISSRRRVSPGQIFF